jgi:hypothetical protein
MSKFDGQAGYRLVIDPDGKAEFRIASGGEVDSITSAQAVNDGNWHHVLAEVDRATGRMTIYVDGATSAEAKASLASDASLDTSADILVGRTHDGAYFRGAMDFLRICQGTLADARTDIAELYAWQSDGPVKYDFAGRAPKGRRDAGALEAE